MGMTFTTLHLWGIGREALLPRLAPGDLLREQNAPWLSVVPDYEEAREDPGRLEKLAKRLTKENESAAALLFYYYDDDWFLVRFFQGGKKTVDSGSAGAWAKLGKKLNALFGDETLGKALRYLSRCSDLQEQIALVEETVGAALFDVSEEEQPRRVPRSDTTLRAIKARESALRRRPKQFVLTELPLEDWPEAVRGEWELKELFRARHPYCANWLMLYPGSKTVPGHENLIAYPYDDEKHLNRLALYDSRSGQLQELGPFTDPLSNVLWRTKRGELVLLSLRTLRESSNGSSWFRSAGMGLVRCLFPDGGERWRFEPDLMECQHLQHVHTSPEGILTLLVGSSRQDSIQYGAKIWRIDGETGEVLYSRCLPETERFLDLAYVEEMDAFCFANSETKEMGLLGNTLQEIARWSGLLGSDQFKKKQICGRYFWEQVYWDQRALYLYNLFDHSIRKTPLEIPVFVLDVLPDGRILGVNERQSTLTVFNAEGMVVSRCTLKGKIGIIDREPWRVCLGEQRWEGPLSMEEGSFHVWRLDPAPEKKKEAKGSKK